jgi:uncharacterized protein (TIGR02147 family)
MDLYTYRDYKVYLRDWVASRPRAGHGVRSVLAKAMNCQTAYFSRVLNGDAHLSLEQAAEANRVIGHNKDESNFFFLLVSLARAGTAVVRKHFADQIEELARKKLTVTSRVAVKEGLSQSDQAIYYQHWYYAAIHVLISVSKMQTTDALAQYLKLPLEKVATVLDFLISVGLAKYEKGRYRVGANRIHLPNHSPFIAKHHTNWRIRAIHSLEREWSEDNLHYSSVVSCSAKDAVVIKSQILATIEKIRDTVKKSGEEVVLCYCLDLFEV